MSLISKKRRLTKRLSGDDSGVFPRHSCTCVPFVYVLNKGVTLMHGAAHYFAIFGENDLYVCLLYDSCVEVSDKDSGIDGTRVILIGHVAGLGLTSHSPPDALLGSKKEAETLEVGCTKYSE